MTRGHDAGGSVDVQADVLGRLKQRFARVQAHPHAHCVAIGPLLGSELALCVYGCRNRIGSAPKDEEERIALVVDLVAVVGGESATKNFAMPGERLRVAGPAQLL